MSSPHTDPHNLTREIIEELQAMGHRASSYSEYAAALELMESAEDSDDEGVLRVYAYLLGSRWTVPLCPYCEESHMHLCEAETATYCCPNHDPLGRYRPEGVPKREPWLEKEKFRIYALQRLRMVDPSTDYTALSLDQLFEQWPGDAPNQRFRGPVHV